MSEGLTGEERKRLCEVGRKCSLLGHKTEDMDRVELIAFIGYLDEHVVSLMCGDQSYSMSFQVKHCEELTADNEWFLSK